MVIDQELRNGVVIMTNSENGVPLVDEKKLGVRINFGKGEDRMDKMQNRMGRII